MDGYHLQMYFLNNHLLTEFSWQMLRRRTQESFPVTNQTVMGLHQAKVASQMLLHRIHNPRERLVNTHNIHQEVLLVGRNCLKPYK